MKFLPDIAIDLTKNSYKEITALKSIHKVIYNKVEWLRKVVEHIKRKQYKKAGKRQGTMGNP